MRSPALLIAKIVCLYLLFTVEAQAGTFKAGAVVVDVTPQTLPVIVNGGMTSRRTDKIKTKLHARGLALSDEKITIVLVVVDSCMMPKTLLDEVKMEAAKKTGIPADKMMFSATHTHTAGSCMGALGTPADENYVLLLKEKLIDTVVKAVEKLQPAKIGFGKTQAEEYTALRRWIRRPDRVALDPFGNPTVRANMHAAKNLDDVTGESGPEDPDLSLISVQTLEGKPLALLANFSMHYFGEGEGISADYFGLFCEGLKKELGPDTEFVGIMSHGCSGDIWRRDYSKPESWEKLSKIEEFAEGLVQKALTVQKSIEHRAEVDLAMSEERMKMHYRVPNKQLLEWSKGIVEKMGDREPKTQEEIYAREQLFLDEKQETEVVTQAIRIGDIGIATTPCETYAITGLKIKAASPLEKIIVIELANGGDGYIPPPEQHQFGGYNTWAARSAGLEVMAEPRITASCIKLLEKVTTQQRKPVSQSRGPAAYFIEQLKPVMWYRMDEFQGPRAIDASGNHHDGIYEAGVTYYLEGPASSQFCLNEETNRCAMFAGGRIHCRNEILKDHWSASLWIWNGMPKEGREIAGWFFSTGDNQILANNSLHLGIGGKDNHPGRLVLQAGENNILEASQTEIPRWTWTHVVLTKEQQKLKIYLNSQLEFEKTLDNPDVQRFEDFFIGGRTDQKNNWEGRLDEVAIFNRILSAAEIKKLGVKD